MKVHRPLFAAVLLIAVQGALAAPSTVQLNNLTLSNFRNHGSANLDNVSILSDNGRFAVLGLDWAGGTALQQTTNAAVNRGYGFTLDLAPADGYAVKSIVLSGFLDVERVNQPSQFDEYNNWLGYSLYILGGGFADGALTDTAPAEDSLLSASVEHLLEQEYIDTSKPFHAEIVTNAWIEGFDPVTGPTPFASITWRNVTVRIETIPVAAIPEPGTWAMLLTGFAGLAGMGYRARRDKH